MTYEKMALIDALRSSTATLSWTEEELAEVAEDLVVSLHEQKYRLTSDGGVSFDD